MNPSAPKSPEDRIARHVATLPRSGIRDFFDVVSTMKGVITLGIGEPDFDTPWHIREASIFALERGATHYTSNLGLLSLRQEIARYVARDYHAAYNPENEVLITVGVSEAMDLAIRALCNPGDEVLYHEPCYVSYRPTVTLAHATPVAVVTRAEDGFKLKRADLEAKVSPRSRVLILNYPNNPTGAALDRAELEDIAAFARDHDLVVLTDEIYSELTYDHPHVSLVALPGMRERTVFLHGFSKAWAMTGYRMGYACAPAPLIEAMMKVHQYTMLCAPVLAQEAALEALRRPGRDVEDMRDEYGRRRNFLHAALTDLGLPVRKPEGAFYMFPRISDFGLPSKEFALRLLHEEKVAAVPGDAFGPCGEGSLRCSYATSLNALKEAVVRIGRFLDRLRAEKR